MSSAPAPASPSRAPETRRSRASARERRARRRTRLLSLVVAPAVVLSTIGVSIWGATTAAQADSFQPAVSITNANGTADHQTDFILAGEDARYDLSVGNESGAGKFNLSVTALVPDDVTFVSADFLGVPVEYAAGDPLPNRTRTAVPNAGQCAPLVPVGAPSLLCTPPDGFSLWVWENVSDLPAGADVTSGLVVRPAADAFPVGTDDLVVAATAYTSDDPTLLPTFDGSTSVSTASGHTSQPGSASRQTPVHALRVAKTEPDPEHELLRGVHANTTTYTIRVQSSGEAPTDGVTVTDYLPAGLEYLGSGGVDNTADSDALSDGDREYPGAPALTGTPAPAGGTGDWSGSGETVETVALDASQAFAAGIVDDPAAYTGTRVYTKVTWSVGDLAGGTEQVYASAAGVPGEHVIRYRAAVPLFENTMTWEIGADDDAPAPAITGAQAANLNNNNGPSTRQGIGTPAYDDAQSMTNAAAAAGTYGGPVAHDPADRAASDSDTETITANDLRVLKSVDPDAFQTNALATYTLELATSEYTSADGITLTDHVANGLCPAFPDQGSPVDLKVDGATVDQATWNDTVSPGSADCDYPNAGGSVTNAAVTSIDYATADGSFDVVFAADAMDAEDLTRTVTYTILQRQTYIPVGNVDGATSSGDSMVNTVEIRGTTASIPALDGVHSTSAVAYGDETVWDDSRATIRSHMSGLTKKVLERDETPATASDDDWVDHAAAPFSLGDTVYYRIRIDFAQDIETRNPLLTDFLPQGVAFDSVTYAYDLPGVGSAPAGSPTNADYIGDPGSMTAGGVLAWSLGDDVYSDSTDRFIPQNSWIEFTIQGTVVGQSASRTVVDKPENQAKYQQQNVDGDVFFLRDDASIDLDWGATLVKGVRDVDDVPAGGNPFDSNVGTASSPVAVVQGDRVTYRVDITTPTTTTAGFTVWDALPEGITAADVVTAPNTYTAALVEKVGTGAADEDPLTYGADFTAEAVDPGPGYPAGVSAEYAGRSLILWHVTAAVPGSDPTTDTVRGLTLGYDVDMPDAGAGAAQVTQRYENTASIVSYGVENNDGGTTTILPEGPISTTAPVPGEYGVPGDDTFDDAVVQLPPPVVVKTVVDSEIEHSGTPVTDPHNDRDQIVQGEHVTFQYTATIPAHTTIDGTGGAGAVLKDDGVLRWTGAPNTPSSHEVAYHLVAGSQRALLDGDPLVDPDFTLDGDGTLHFPVAYQNDTAAAQVFAVQITVWLDGSVDLPNGKTLTNTARLTYGNPNDGSAATASDTANVTYIEPNLRIVKTASPNEDVKVGDPVDYTLTVTNDTNTPISYDNVIVDTVPAGIIVDTDSFTGGGTLSWTGGVENGTGGTITWYFAEIPATVTLGYQAEIDPLTGAGQDYVNTAVAKGYTLPADIDGDDTTARRGERTDDDDATVTAITAGIEKGVRVAGSTAPFAASASAPIGDTVVYRVAVTLEQEINYYQPVISDDLPAGAVLQSATIDGPVDPSGTIAGTWDYALDAGTNTATWTYHDGADDTIPADAAQRTLTLTYEVLLSNATAANSLPNTADFAWNSVQGGGPGTVQTVEDSAGVTVLNPTLTIDKTVSDPSPAPGETFDYTIVATNPGTVANTRTPAYNMVFTDVVEPGVAIEPGTISPAPSSADAGVFTGLGGTITWDHADVPALDGPLYPASSGDTPSSLTFTYSATLADSATLSGGVALDNTATATHLESFPTGGRVYTDVDSDDATVTPAFPALTAAKTTTGSDVAYVEHPFGWTLTLTNTGDAPAQTVVATDTLPGNWDFTTVSSITVGGAPIDPGTVLTALSGVGTPADPRVITWTFGAASPAAPVLQPGQSIVIAYTATPNASATDDPGTGTTHPHRNALVGAATDTSDAAGNDDGPYESNTATADAFIHAADLVLRKDPGAGLVAGGAAGTAWTIAVSNSGPDTAVGPFTVTDTWGDAGTLPDGLSVVSVTGDGWSCLTTGTGFTCTRQNAADTLAAGAAFPVITVTARAAATFDPADSPVPNTATVTSSTFDPDSDNDTDDADVPVSVSASLSIEKTTVTADPHAGEPLTWLLQATNDGPAVSQDTVTMTDVLPSGISDVTPAPGADWTCVASGGPFPAQAGETITCTYVANAGVMPVGDAGPVTLTGTIAPSFTGTLSNTARISQGPDEEGSSTISDPVDDGTTIVASKDRVDPAPPADIVPGETVTYELGVTNTGSADARDVTVVDTVPAGLHYQSSADVAGAWTCAETTGSPNDLVTCALSGPLTTAAPVAAVRLTFAIDPSVTSDVVNVVRADADNADPDDADTNDDTDPKADLEIFKTPPAAPVLAGTSRDYTLRVQNHGPSDTPVVKDADTLTVTDAVPSGMTPTAAAGTGWDCDIAGQTVTCARSDDTDVLASGASFPDITVTVAIAPELAPQTLTNTAHVAGVLPDPVPLNNTATASAPITSEAAVTIDKTVTSPGPHRAGETVTYEIALDNAGPSIARSVLVTDIPNLSGGLRIDALTPSSGTCVVATAVCTVGDLPVGDDVLTIEVTATILSDVADGTTLTNQGVVGWTDSGGTHTDDDAEPITTVAEADLVLTKTAVDDTLTPITTAVAGTTVDYRLQVHNDGPSDAVGPLAIADTLPEHFSFVSVVSGAWTCDADPLDPRSVECTSTGGLAAGADAEDLVIRALIDPAAPVAVAPPATNEATVTSGTTDPDPSNNTDTAGVEVTQSADLSITKTHDQGRVRIGDELDFAIGVHNAGPSDATDVVVVDTIPAGLEYVDADGSDPAWTVVADPAAPDGTTTVTATLAGALEVGDDAPALVLTTLVTVDAYSSVVNEAEVAATQPDPDPADNEATDPVDVPAQAALVIEKEAVGGFQVGSTAEYSLTVTNLGPTEDPGPVTVTDALPDGLLYRSSDSADASCDANGRDVTCTLNGPLAVGASARIVLTVAIGVAAYPEVTNTAVVSSPTEQLPDAVLSDAATTPVAARPLPATGGAFPGVAAAAAILLLGLGGILLSIRRRRA